MRAWARTSRWAPLLLLAGAAGSTGAADTRPELRPAQSVVLVVHVWASWCEPCRPELEQLAAFYRGPYRELAADGLRLVTVSEDVRERDLDRYLAEHAPPFPVYRDSLAETRARYALRGLPATLLLDGRGEVVARLLGPQRWTHPDFLDRLRGWLREGGEP